MRIASCGASVRATASLAGIVAILVGVPILLWQLGTPLLPSRVPSLHEALAVFLRPDDGSLLMGTLLVIGVLVWAQLCLSILAELVAALRHRPGLRVELPGLGASRLLASVLVAGVLGAGGTGPALAAQPVAAVVAADHRTADHPTADPVITDSSPIMGRELPRYVVQERDSLWRIAEARLGDPLRWREIYDLNHAVVQPDGGRLTEATLLHPGWTLRLPADAATTDVTAVVHAGDTLGNIATTRLHDPRRAEEIFDLNVGRPQPNGVRLTDPNRIQPGWRLTLPATPAPTVHPRPAAPSTDDPTPSPTVPTVPGHPPTHTEPRTADPTTTESTSTEPKAAEPTTTVPTTTVPTTAPTTHTPSSSVATPNAGTAPVSAPVGVVAEWGVSALVVSGLVAALTLGRRRQQRHRGYRRRIAVPDDPAGRREWHAVTTPSPVDTATLDAALRGLALRDWSNQTAPDLTRVVLAPDQATLHLADQTTAAPPFVPGEDAVTWLLPGDANLPLDPDEAGRYCAPYPLLVSVAADDDQLLLLDLEHLGYATVTGERDTAVGLLRHIAAELANARWSDDVEILLVGFGGELPPLNTDRLRVLPDLAAALTEMRVARQRIAATREATGTGVVEGRLSGTAPDGWLPVLLLVADLTATDEHARAELHALVDEPPERGFAVLAHDTDVVGTEIRITDDGNLLTPGAGADAGPGRWRVETMTAAIAGGLADILAPTTAPDLPAGPAEHPEPWAADMDTDGALTRSDDTSSDDDFLRRRFLRGRRGAGQPGGPASTGDRAAAGSRAGR